MTEDDSAAAVEVSADAAVDPDDATPGRSGLVGALIVAAAVVLAAIGLAVVPSIDLSLDGSSSDADTTLPTTTAVPDACSDAHTAHNVAMWDPTMADEMLEAGCPWPYEPFMTPTDGGEQNPNLAAPFEPRLYSELWDALQEADFGVCAVAALAEQSGDGFVFGFRYEVRPGGCEEGEQVAELVVREHVTRAWRDAAAAALGAEGPVLVLGRWTFTVENATDFAANRLFETLVALGAVTAGGPTS